MTEHAAEAARLLDGWREAVDNLPEKASNEELHAQIEQGAAIAVQALAAAQAHATLAQVDLMREIRDHLDTFPRVATVSSEPEPPADPLWDAPLYKAASMLERIACGEDGEYREWTVARLVAHAIIPHPAAANIAVTALNMADSGVKAENVKAAIALLRIDTTA